MPPLRLSASHRAQLFACLLVLFTLLSTAAAPRPQTGITPEAIPVELRDKVESMRERYTHWQEPPIPPVLTKETAAPQANPQPDPAYAFLTRWDQVTYQIYTNKGWEIGIMGQTMESSEFRLTDNYASDVRPRMTTDGEVIAFASNRDGQYEIYTTTKDGLTVRRLTKSSATDTMPAWSPKDSQIVFVSDRTGGPEIYVMFADGSNLRQLTDNHGTNINPTWSPDGTQIAWVQSAEDFGVIVVMNADGSNQHIITGQLPYLYGLAWSFDSKLLVFDYDANGDYWFDLGVVNADGSDLRAISLGSPFKDLGIGSWNQKHGYIDCFVTNYEYIYNQGIYVTSSDLFQCYTDGTKQLHNPYFYQAGIFMYPDARRVDSIAPTAWIEPLPAYTKLAGSLVNVRAVDDGVSGLGSVTLYKKVSLDDNWQYIESFPIDRPISISRLQNATGPVYFQALANDHAGNIESESSLPDAFTILYRYSLTARITDARETPLARANVASYPNLMNLPMSGSDGRLNGYFDNSGTYNLVFAAPGFRALTNVPVTLNTDVYLPTLALGPLNNIVQNGTFENSNINLPGWTTGGSMDAPVSTTRGFMDAKAARLASSSTGCSNDPCFISEDVLSTTTIPYVTFYDGTGTAHFFIGDSHLWRSSPSDTFTSEKFTAKTVTNLLDAFTDSQNSLHVLFFSSEGQLFYTRWKDGTGWIEPEPITSMNMFTVKGAVDNQGILHLVGQKTGDTNGKISHIRRTGPNQWSAIQSISTLAPNYAVIPNPGGGITIAIGDYVNWTDVVNIVPISSNGVIGTIETAQANKTYGTVGRVFAQYDSAGRLYVSNYNGFFATRETDGTWDTQDYYTDTTRKSIYGMAVTADGMVYLMDDGTSPVLYVKGEDSEYFQSMPTNLPSWNRRLSIGWQGQPYLAYMAVNTNNPYRLKMTTFPVASAGDATLSQTMTLPAATHKPTLAFQFALRTELPNSLSRMDVFITPEGQDPVTVFTSDSTSDWKHTWLDLSDYLGKTFAITFKLTQPEGEPTARLLLDDISVGGWTTPILESVSPAETISGPATLTLTGQNFMEGAAVQVGTTWLSSVVVNSEGELTAELPAGLAPGVLDVIVKNPGGASDTLPNALRLGSWLYIPQVSK